MRIQRLSSWLVPLTLGTLGSAVLAVSLACALGPTEPLLGGRWLGWVFAMMVTVPVAIGLVLAGAFWDVVRLKLFGHAPPTGLHGWLVAAATPLVTYGSYLVFRPGAWPGARMALALLGPIVFVPLLVRWVATVLGLRPVSRP